MTPFEQLFDFIKKPWVIIFYTIFVILAYYFIDKPLAIYFFGTKIPFLQRFTTLGEWIVSMPLFFITGMYFRYIQVNPTYEARSWYLFSCVLLANVICFILKVTLGRARPDLFLSHHEFGFYWFKRDHVYWSFPSGHTATIISAAAGLGEILPRYFYAALSVALLVALSRIVLCFHYLSDVTSTLYLSLLTVGFVTESLKKKNSKLNHLQLTTNWTQLLFPKLFSEE